VEQAEAAVREAFAQAGWECLEPWVVKEGLRTYLLRDSNLAWLPSSRSRHSANQVTAEVRREFGVPRDPADWGIEFPCLLRAVVDMDTGKVLRIWRQGYPVKYIGSPIGWGPWISPQEAWEFARREAETRGGYDWFAPVVVSYNYIKRIYTVTDRQDTLDGLPTRIDIDARNGTIRRYDGPWRRDELEAQIAKEEARPEGDCICSEWEPIHGFRSWDDAEDFERWIEDLVHGGFVEEISQIPLEGYVGERVFRCPGCARLWRYWAPDYPFTGEFVLKKSPPR
jgi:hypothetical protein